MTLWAISGTDRTSSCSPVRRLKLVANSNPCITASVPSWGISPAAGAFSASNSYEGLAGHNGHVIKHPLNSRFLS